MFFYIGEHTPYLTKVHDRLYLDQGWTRVDNCWYKGYSTDCVISENLDRILKGYTPKGIWCVINYDTEYKIYHSELRGFPLYKNTNSLTNFVQEDSEFISNNYNAELLKECNSNLDVVVKTIADTLINNFLNFKKFNNLELNVWCTGGLDSTCLIAILEYVNIPYNIFIAKPKNYNGNVREFEGSINEYSSEFAHLLKDNYWGYEIISWFKEPITLVTGFYGDEFLCRGPYQINDFCNIFGKSFSEYLDDTQYMYKYLVRSQKKNVFNINVEDAKIKKQRILQHYGNDYQIWHFDNVITFCPYYDLDILNQVLSIEPEKLIEYSLNGTVQKEIINKYKPDILKLVDTYKNTQQGRSSFYKNVNQVQLNYCKNLIWV